jgi:ADP-ribose pyrophosphatase YjhB (NUDIX family)
MADNMVQFDKNDIRFLLCARGIVIHQERVLLFNVIGWDWWALPGGRAEMSENSEATLRREMKEELNTDIDIKKLVWVVENFFGDESTTYHEIGMYYLISLPADSSLLGSEEYRSKDGPVTLRFRWFPLTTLEHLNLYPVFLRKELLHIPEHIEHIVWNDK